MSTAKRTSGTKAPADLEYIPPPLPPGVVKALRVFKAHFPELLKKHPDKWVACDGEPRVVHRRLARGALQEVPEARVEGRGVHRPVHTSRRDRIHRLNLSTAHAVRILRFRCRCGAHRRSAAVFRLHFRAFQPVVWVRLVAWKSDEPRPASRFPSVLDTGNNERS